MGNNKNKKPKKESNKGQESKKASSSKTSPGQKENRPKKTKIKPDPGDRIAMSQELMKHTKRKSNSNKSRTKPDSKRVLPNGKIMPSLADLEKMFEDSDDDANSEDLPKTDTKTSSPVENIVVDIDTIFSPSTCAKVSQQCKEILNNWSKTSENDATTAKVQSPPRKRLNFETYGNMEECDDLPLVTTTPKKMKCDTSDTQVIESNQENYQDELRISPIPDLSKNVEKLTKETDDGNLSETSVDSNKTIEYKLTPSTLQSNIISQAFCPLPSTSKDDKTFTKNDELFFECTKEINNNKTKENFTSSQITNTPMETSELDDEIIIEECQNDIKKEVDNDIKKEVDNDIEIVDTTDQNNSSEILNPGDNKYDDDDDDDCIFVDCYTSTTKEVSKEPEIIDLEYDFIDSDTYNYHTSSYDDIDDEVIDVDALIAKNQSILNKYKTSDTNKLDSTNLVVDVDVSKIVENSTGKNNMQKQDSSQNIPSTAPEITNNTPNLQGHPNNEDEVIHITDLDAKNRRHNQVRRNLSNNQSVTYPDVIDVESITKKKNRKKHTFTEQDVSKFFNGDRNPQIGQPSTVCYFLYDLIRNLQFENDSPATQLPETSQKTFNPPPMLQNTPSIPVESHRASSAYQQSQPFPSASQRTPYVPSLSPQRAEPAPGTSLSQRTQPAPPGFQQMQPTHSSTQKKQRTPKTKRNSNNNPLLSPIRPPPSPEKPSRKLGECPICMEKLSDKVIASTICGHVFCMSCLEQAIKTNKRCPTCRKFIKKNGYHQIFL